MTIPQTIQKAIEGGWKEPSYISNFNTGSANLSMILMDPLFWQSLGKGMKWDEHIYFLRCPCCDEVPRDESRMYTWIYQWHKLINDLAKGNTIESFFKTIN